MGSLLSLTQIPKRVLYFLSISDKVQTAEKKGTSTLSPLVKTSPANAEGAGSIPGWEAKIP